MRDFGEYFRILDLPMGASEDEIRRAYKVLVNVWHPDRFQHDASLRSAAEEKLKAINEAFGQLRAVGFKAPPDSVANRRAHAPSGSSSSAATSTVSSAGKPPSPRRPRGPALSKLLATAARHVRADRYDEAVLTLSRAAELYPHSFEAWHDLAWACDYLWGRLGGDGSEPLLRPDRSVTPFSPQAARLGMSAAEVKIQGDRASYEAIRLAPNRKETTDLLRSKNRWSDRGAAVVRSLCEERASTEPGNPRAWENLGYLLYATVEDKAPAGNALKRSLQLDPDNAQAWFRLGLCLKPDDWKTRDECRMNLKRLGQAVEASILQSTVPLGARMRRWFR